MMDDDIIDIVRKYHHNPEDLETGDIDCRIKQYGKYTLGAVELKDINLGEWEVIPGLVKAIAAGIKKSGKVDPIVFDPVNKSVIDGIHRANAAKSIGKTSVNAWIGDKETYDEKAYGDCMANKFPDSDEWKPDADEYGIGPEDE